MNSEALLCGIPISFEDYKPREGFQKIGCDCCNEICWIGPRQLSLKNESVEFLCVFCVLEKYGQEAIENLAHLGG